MEINQESSSPNLLTKSSRKRQRKKLAAALEKNLIASEVTSLNNIESVQKDAKSETRKEYLSKIVTPPTPPQKTETSNSKVNVQDAVKSKTKIISCEAVENVLPETSEGKTSNPEKLLSVSQSKRRRNRKKTIVPEVSGDGLEVNIVSKSQKSVDVPKCLAQNVSHHSTPQKDCISEVNKLASLTPLNLGDLKNPVLDKNTHSVATNSAVKTDGTTNSKLREEESIEKAQSHPHSKRRRNRKKVIVSEVSNSTLGGNIENKKNIELPEYIPKHSISYLPSQEDRAPGKEDLTLANSISLIDVDNQVIGKNLHFEKTNFTAKPVAVTLLGDKYLLDSGLEKSSVVIEKFEQKEKTLEVSNKKCDLGFMRKNPGTCNKEEVCKGESEAKENKVSNYKLDMSSDTRPDFHQSEKHKSKAAELVDVTKSPMETELEFQREQSQSSYVFKQTGIYCSHTSHTAVNPSSCPAVAGATMEKNNSVKESPVGKMSKDLGEKTDLPRDQVLSVPEKKLDIKGDVVDAVVMAMDNVKIKESKEGPITDAQNIIEYQEVNKAKEKIKAEREARKAAKLAKKQKVPGEVKGISETAVGQIPVLSKALVGNKIDEVVLAKCDDEPNKPGVPLKEGESGGKTKAELRAERRAKQEAQRAAKALPSSVTPSQAKGKNVEEKSAKIVQETNKNEPKKRLINVKAVRKEQGDKLLSRLGWGDGRVKRGSSEGATLRDTQTIHPAIVQLSTRFTDRIISGSNARCLAFVQAIKKVIQDYQTPSQKELGRDLEARLLTPSLAYLEAQRPHAVSVSNATRFLKWQLTQLQSLQQCCPESTAVPYSETRKSTVITDEEAKKSLVDSLDAYIWEKIKVAEEAVCETLKDKIRDGDVILTYGCSYLLQQILMGAKEAGTKFKVIVVDGRPWREGREMLRCLVAVGIPCSYVLLSAASSVMRQVNKVLLGAHALLSNGYVMSRVGVSQVALLASAHNVPVLVACETHKFCERVQSDSFVHNEMGEPDGLAQLLGGEDGPLSGWRSIPSLSLLNLSYDVTPPELVTAVATELAVLPCTSVPVVLRVRPTEPIASRH